MEKERMNTCSIIGFVMAFFCPIVGLIFSILGYNQARKNDEPGKGLAIAGIIISCILGLLLLVLVLLFMFLFLL